MKNLNSNTEGVWTEQLPLTEAQIQILKTGTQEEKQAVLEAVNIAPQASDLLIAIATYNQHKPTDENYHLIGCNLTIGETTWGIINCRINGEHKQIRF